MNKGRLEQIIEVLKSGEKTLQELSDAMGLTKENIYSVIIGRMQDLLVIMPDHKFNEATGRMNTVYRLANDGEKIKRHPNKPKVVSGIPVIVFLNEDDYKYLTSVEKSTKSNNFRAIINDSRRYRTRHQI